MFTFTFTFICHPGLASCLTVIPISTTETVERDTHGGANTPNLPKSRNSWVLPSTFTVHIAHSWHKWEPWGTGEAQPPPRTSPKLPPSVPFQGPLDQAHTHSPRRGVRGRRSQAPNYACPRVARIVSARPSFGLRNSPRSIDPLPSVSKMDQIACTVLRISVT